MGHSFSGPEPALTPNQALILYDKMQASKAREHIKTEFVTPDSLVDHLQPGDMIQKKGNWVYQWFYSHFAIYIGNGEIVHVNKVQDNYLIVRDNMVSAFNGELVRKNNHLDNAILFCNSIKNPRKIVKDAREMVGTPWNYSVLFHNCEHFATQCRYGRAVSLQNFGIFDLMNGNINFNEYLEHSIYRINEKCDTFLSWIYRKTIGLFHSIG